MPFPEQQISIVYNSSLSGRKHIHNLTVEECGGYLRLWEDQDLYAVLHPSEKESFLAGGEVKYRAGTIKMARA